MLHLSQYKKDCKEALQKTRKEFHKDKTESCSRNDSKSLYKTFNYLGGSEQELILPYHKNKLVG